MTNEIALIIINEYENLCEWDIIFTKWVNGVNKTSIKWISQNHAAYMLLYYVLFFMAIKDGTGLYGLMQI